MKIINYRPEYKEAVENICLKTASLRARAEESYHQFTLMMYCDCYLEHEMCLLLKEEAIAGYILCAPDLLRYLEHFRPYWLKINELGEEYRKRVDHEIAEYERFKESYPAHLHIDLDPAITAHGYGSKLMRALLEELTERKVKGVMLGVSKTNQGAIHFYQKNGFHILESHPDSLLMGYELTH